MLPLFKADLHIHTCLSPCGDLDMSPRGIVEAARALNLDLIAICDHNTAENAAAACRAAKRDGGRVKVLSGLEVCTSEEVHVLALFETPEKALDMQALVYDRMPPKTNRPEIFGEQVVANEDDEVEGFNERLLIGSVNLSLNGVTEAIHERGGLAVAAHIDRESYGLLGQLGFFPPDLDVDAIEISSRCNWPELLAVHPELTGKPVLRSSDAHYVKDIGSGWTEFQLEEPTLKEIGLAFRKQNGRNINRIS